MVYELLHQQLERSTNLLALKPSAERESSQFYLNATAWNGTPVQNMGSPQSHLYKTRELQTILKQIGNFEWISKLFVELSIIYQKLPAITNIIVYLYSCSFYPPILTVLLI